MSFVLFRYGRCFGLGDEEWVVGRSPPGSGNKDVDADPDGDGSVLLPSLSGSSTPKSSYRRLCFLGLLI